LAIKKRKEIIIIINNNKKEKRKGPVPKWKICNFSGGEAIMRQSVKKNKKPQQKQVMKSQGSLKRETDWHKKGIWRTLAASKIFSLAVLGFSLAPFFSFPNKGSDDSQ